jgi:hypothetical protein
MGAPSCLGCQQRDETIAELRLRLAALEAHIHDLEDQLGRNATNSSLPPSANPPGAPKLPPKKATGRKTGAQPGHPAHLRRRLPAERLQHTRDFVPRHCQRCHEPLPPTPAEGDPEPSWHQVAELPRLAAEVTEYRGHFRTCPACGTLNHAAIPAELKAHSIGPRLAATLCYLAGRHHLSQRGLEELAEDVFAVPLSLGTVDHLAEQASAALAPAHAEAVHAVLLWLRDNSKLRRLFGHDHKPGWHTTTRAKAVLYDVAGELIRDGDTIIHGLETYLHLGHIEGSTLLAPPGQRDDRAVAYCLALQARARSVREQQARSRPWRPTTLSSARAHRPDLFSCCGW